MLLVTFRCTKNDDIHIEQSSFTLVETTSYNALGPISKTRTDAAGRNLQTIEFVDQGSPPTEESSWTYYDETGNVVGFRDANGVGYDATYDELGRITSRTDTYGDQVTWGDADDNPPIPGYDAEGNVLHQFDAKQKQTSYTYDARNRRVKTIDRLNGETITTYTVLGQIETLMDADAESAGNNEVTRYNYNERGEKTSEEFPGHNDQSNPGQETFNKVAFQYDPAGRLSLKTDQLGDTVTYKYDLAGRLENREYRTAANSPNGTIADTDTFTYDHAGRMLTAASGRYVNTVTMAYDDAGRLESEELDINSKQYTTTRKYNNLGQLEKLFYPDGNTVVERQYTHRGQLEKVLVDYDGESNGAAAIEEMVNTFDPGGRRSTATFASTPSIVTTYEYRGGVAATPTGNIIAGLDGVPIGDTTPRDNLVKEITTSGTFGNHAGIYSYQYDANKNKTRETITGTANGQIPIQDEYGFNTGTNNDQVYDDEDRLIEWNRDDGNLNRVWNLSLVRDFNSVTTNTNQVTWTHNPAHETTAVDSVTTTYDVKGNLTTNIDGDTYIWDFDNKMSSADTDGDTIPNVTFKYDALGRRVAKNNTVYAMAGQQVVAEYASTAPVTAPTETFVYASYIDELILKKERKTNSISSATSRRA